MYIYMDIHFQLGSPFSETFISPRLLVGCPLLFLAKKYLQLVLHPLVEQCSKSFCDPFASLTQLDGVVQSSY